MTSIAVGTQTRQFLTHLWRGGAWAYLWTPDTGRFYTNKKTGELEEAKESAWRPVGQWPPIPLSWASKNIYFGLFASTVQREMWQRTTIATAAAVNCFFGDFDVKDYGSKEAILTHLATVPLSPSVIVDSGGGLHVYWLISEPVLLTDTNRTDMRRLLYAWVDFVGSDKNAKDIARVLRLPGSRNLKKEYGPDFPEVKFIECNLSQTYALEEFERLASHLVEKQAPETKYEGATNVMDDLAAAIDALQRLSRQRREDYADWIKVGMALSDLGDTGKALWKEWSAGSGKYDSAVCDAKWATFNPDEIKLGSLIYMADQDAPRPKREKRQVGAAARAEAPNGNTPATLSDPAATGPTNDNASATMPDPAATPVEFDDAPAPTLLDSLIADLAPVEPGEMAQQWAVQNIPAAAKLSETERLQLYMELRNRKVPKLFLDRNWLPAVRRQAEEAVRVANTASSQQHAERYRVLAHRIHEAREHVDQATGNVTIDWRPLCNFDARIIADVEEDDGEHITRQLAIVGALATGEALPEVKIKAVDFEKMTWPIESWGARVSIEPGRGVKDKLRHAIQTLSDEGITSRRVYTHTGWRLIDGDRVFLTASGGLGLPDISINLPGNLNTYALPQDQRIDEATAMRASIALLDVAPDTITSPLWAAMFLAPLSELITPAFTVWVEGESGSLKSSLGAVMLNHFGAGFTEFNLPAAWDGTANSLEKLCFHAKDIPLLIDDFRPVTNRYESQKLQDAASKIIRAAGNRQGRSRLDSESDFRRVFSPRGVVVATAERGALGKSTNARLLTIDVSPGDVKPTLLAQAQAQREIYGYAMAGYVRWVGRQYDKLGGQLRQNVERVRTLQNGNGHKRLPGAMATLYTAFCLALEYAEEIKAITTDEAKTRAERCYNALQQLAEDQADLIASQDPALQFLQVIATLLRARKVQIEGEKSSRTMGDDGALVERIGWHDGQNIYLLQTAYNCVARYLNAQGEMIPSDEITLNKEMERRGYLAKRNQTDDRIKVQRFDPGQPGKRTRVIVLRLETLFEIAADMQIDKGDLYSPTRSTSPQE